MKWIKQFKGILFDLDGLLVNTEELHYAAYKKVLKRRGYILDWSFSTFCNLAHSGINSLRDAIHAYYPQLLTNALDWQDICREKKVIYLEILRMGNIEYMPGVERLLQVIAAEKIKCCVVTNSPLEETIIIRHALPHLNRIPFWITREQYANPKPNPDAYLTAIKKLELNRNDVIGFEDSWRGYNALLNAEINGILICPTCHLPLNVKISEIKRFDSFEEISDQIDLSV